MAKKAIRRTRKRSNLPQCTKLYAKALLDPFDPSVVGVCYPSGLTIPSMKFSQRIKGTCTVNADGIGFIQMRDCLNKQFGAINSSNSNSVYGAVDDLDTVFSAVTNTTATNFTQIPFDVATFTGKGIEGRMVTMGYRYKYAGRQDALAGLCYDLEEPDHQNNGDSSMKTVVDHRMTYLHPVDNNWHYVKWSGPVKQEEVDYSGTGYAGGNGEFILSTVFTGLTSGSALVWEAIMHCEFHGTQAFATTFNQVDDAGASKVVNAAKKDAQDHTVDHLQTVIDVATDPRVVSAVMAGGKVIYDTMHSRYAFNLLR